MHNLQVTDAESTLQRAGTAELLHGIAEPVKLGLIRLLNAVDEATAAELGPACQASAATVRRHLEAMVTAGLVAEQEGQSDGLSPGRPAARFRLAPEIREAVELLLFCAGDSLPYRSPPAGENPLTGRWPAP